MVLNKSPYQEELQQKVLGELSRSPTLNKYKDTLRQCIYLYYPRASQSDIDAAIDYSIQKRFKDSKNVRITNSYKRYRDENDNYKDAEQKITLQKLSDYILSREPIVTPHGTMFMHHGTVPNPLVDVIMSFLDLRSEHKKMMFEFPKGSANFEKYNLLQQLDKIDANGVYGCLGQFSALIYNNNVASSVTAAGRAAVSSMTLHFEALLANNVKFGSLDEIVEFINHIKSESLERKFDDRVWLNHWISPEECFAQIILTCGYRWIPDEKEMDIIWKIINNLSQVDLNRVYYKNNLYEFMENPKIFDVVHRIIINLEKPLLNSLDIPPEIEDDIQLFKDLIFEYVYYRYMYIDRIDRCDNMIKAVTMVSDTDSTIISLDAWYRYILEKINGEELRIANKTFIDPDNEIKLEPRKLDYNFQTDEIVEAERLEDMESIPANDNVRYTIINILANVLDTTVNDYMIQMCKNNYSHKEPYHTDCKIKAKTEFLFKRLMMTLAKKHYASFIEVQEGNMVPRDQGLDIKGIDILAKSVTPDATKKALKKILLEDVLLAPSIDQVRFIKDIAIFEKQIVESVRNGDKEFFKPATVKSLAAYSDPMKIQGVKASLAWNALRTSEYQAIDMDQRNAVDIVKVIINHNTADKIKDTYPEAYDNMIKALDGEDFKTYAAKPDPKTGIKKLLKNEITSVAIPLDTQLPPWLEPFIDYDTIIANNLNGFPYESIGLKRMGKNNVGYTNIIEI